MRVNLHYIKTLNTPLKSKCFWLNEEKCHWGIHVPIIRGHLPVSHRISPFLEIILTMSKQMCFCKCHFSGFEANLVVRRKLKRLIWATTTCVYYIYKKIVKTHGYTAAICPWEFHGCPSTFQTEALCMLKKTRQNNINEEWKLYTALNSVHISFFWLRPRLIPSWNRAFK